MYTHEQHEKGKTNNFAQFYIAQELCTQLTLRQRACAYLFIYIYKQIYIFIINLPQSSSLSPAKRHFINYSVLHFHYHYCTYIYLLVVAVFCIKVRKTCIIRIYHRTRQLPNPRNYFQASCLPFYSLYLRFYRAWVRYTKKKKKQERFCKQ